ncbi:hypothetical protein HDU93_007080 [Gonapodya sp. JEL0774]|nr:hypothetical protein HDU93_007080 [Gonapodya sp. JEL0774]
MLAWPPPGVAPLKDGGREFFDTEESAVDPRMWESAEAIVFGIESGIDLTVDEMDSGYDFNATSSISPNGSTCDRSPSSAGTPNIVTVGQSANAVDNVGAIGTITGLTRDVELLLLLEYFKCVYPQMPIVHPYTLISEYASGKVESVLLLCVSTFVSDPRIDQERIFQLARSVLYSRLEQGPSVLLVQSLLHANLYAASTGSRGTLSYLYTGMAISMAQQIGLNLDPDDLRPSEALSDSLTWIEKETRRRLYWAVYALDKQSSLIASRSCMIRDEDCKARLPCKQIVWETVAVSGPGNAPYASQPGLNVSQIVQLAATGLESWPSQCVAKSLSLNWGIIFARNPELLIDSQVEKRNADAWPTVRWSELTRDERMLFDKNRPGLVSFPEQSDPFGWLVILENIFGKVIAYIRNEDVFMREKTTRTSFRSPDSIHSVSRIQ